MFKVEKIVNRLIATDYEGNKFELSETFPIELWDCPEAYLSSDIVGYEPMLAKELDSEEVQDVAFNNPNNIIEEKFDGTRALVYFISQGDESYCRVFSRRISNKTGFYVENTDSLPQIKELKVPTLAKTILDGEMFIDGLPFREVASTMNCLWDRAVERQIEKGFITFHAFDILFYCGIDLRQMPLHRRKEYLKLAVEEANCPYIREVDYYSCGTYLPITVEDCLKKFNKTLDDVDIDTYPSLSECIESGTKLTPRAYYELIVATGGEGVIIKPKDGKYLHKRGWEYSKIKKFLTREMIVTGFSEPTREYTGKSLKSWGYWVEEDTDKRVQGNFYNVAGYTPVTKHYFMNQVGNLLLSVIISKGDYEKISPNKRGRVVKEVDSDHYLMEVCECSGFDEESRDYFTKHQEEIVGSVVEIKANEIMRDSGRLRHPRYLRMRFDKEPERCTWEDHIL